MSERNQKPMARTNKTYIIVGDNNFWYATMDGTLKQAQSELKRIARVIKKGVGSEFDEPSEASELYLYEAKELDTAYIEE